MDKRRDGGMSNESGRFIFRGEPSVIRGKPCITRQLTEQAQCSILLAWPLHSDNHPTLHWKLYRKPSIFNPLTWQGELFLVCESRSILGQSTCDGGRPATISNELSKSRHWKAALCGQSVD